MNNFSYGNFLLKNFNATREQRIEAIQLFYKKLGLIKK